MLLQAMKYLNIGLHLRQKLIIGQHGCNYCTTKYKINMVEEKYKVYYGA